MTALTQKKQNGHIDDMACFVAAGEVACIWTDDPENPFYEASHAAYAEPCCAVDARGRTLKVEYGGGNIRCITQQELARM